MKANLSTFEKELRLKVRNEEQIFSKRSDYVVAASVALAPFWLCFALFVPLFGALMALLNCLSLFFYLKLRRNLFPSLIVAIGLILGIGVASLLGLTLPTRRDSIMYFVIGLSPIVSIISLFVIAGCSQLLLLPSES